MNIEDVIKLIEYIKSNDEDFFIELDKRFNRMNEILDEMFGILWEIREENKKPISKIMNNENEEISFK